MESLLLPLLLFGAMWLLLIRPQQQRLRAQRALLEALEVGDEVLTAGGVFGRIIQLGDERVRLEVAPGVRLDVLRPAITRRVEARDRLDVDADPPAVEDL